MDCLVRLVQVHESFRRSELVALAEISDVALEIKDYRDDVGGFQSTSSLQ